MAVFGLQLVVTMVMASVLSRITPHYSLARWLLCSTGLVYYLHPTDEELRSLAGVPKDKGKKGKGGGKGSNKSGTAAEDDGTFTVPRSLDLSLETSRMVPGEVMQLKFYTEYQWLLDFSLCSAIVYVITEIFMAVASPQAEVNLSMLWCLLAVGFSLKVMFSLSMLYFCGEDSGGEKAMVVLSFFTYLLIALGMLILDESKLELGLDLAYSSFNSSAAAFLKAQGLPSDGPASKVTFKIIIAMLCALIGAFYTFPGLRLGKMHWDSLRYCTESKVLKLLFHISFVAPLFLVTMWIKPISRRYFTEYTLPGRAHPLMSSDTFDILRIVLILVVGVVRLGMMPYYLQSYLNLAYEKIEAQKKESGRITNKDLQKKIARVFYYLCVVTLQYIAPIILCLFLSLMFKTLGGLSWGALIGRVVEPEECGLAPDSENEDATTIPTLQNVQTVMEATKILTLGMEELKKVFTTEFYRGVLGFTTWWCVFSWFLSGTFGVAYQSYFTKG
ncbi:transmembrane protein 161B [Procambarus clarkii]|uniref:transmembrane protein 161B n=1 Tax=Procambarus clarkii TaxID=6728 RepID=UPI001E6750A3|nr:transmembrane protein 161B-like [Procambarus clarkii]